jgi:hypothetical protein
VVSRKPGETNVGDSGDPELDAIRVVVEAFTPLDGKTRSRIVDYVSRRFGIGKTSQGEPTSDELKTLAPDRSQIRRDVTAHRETVDIRQFTSSKSPTSGIEMVSVLAYFLAYETSPADRKFEIDSGDIRKYFAQADFPLPAKPRQCLVDAKNKGWLERGTGPGKYKLTPVGQNLVRHKMSGRPA